ncbi:MAG: response regulator [Deltaproteobacteria bacterium]|nr:MAG: response regulator [Deltaproteobacteria bacterium]
MEPKIIVIDPSDFSRRLTVEMLEDLNFTVMGEANSLERAQEIIKNVYCNICLVDMNLGEISGIEFCENLTENNEGLGVILTTYLTLEKLKIDAILSGAIDVLEHPIDKKSLEKSIIYVQKTITEKE